MSQERARFYCTFCKMVTQAAVVEAPAHRFRRVPPFGQVGRVRVRQCSECRVAFETIELHLAPFEQLGKIVSGSETRDQRPLVSLYELEERRNSVGESLFTEFSTPVQDIPEIEGFIRDVYSTLDGLTARETLILRLFFGIEARAVSIPEIARELDISEKEIGFLLGKALRKLRHPTRSDHLRPKFYEIRANYPDFRCAELALVASIFGESLEEAAGAGD